MKTIKIKCPAKVNLTLEILNKRDDGYHNIKSIMHTISLYDILTIKIEEHAFNEITLSGNSDKIPYDEKNIVYKAILLYLQNCEKNYNVSVNIQKNIPVEAGLAGGSTDAAGVLYGLNSLIKKYSHSEIEGFCAKLGSDLNVCLNGGCVLATSRGEVTEKLPALNHPITLIKPKNLGISTKTAYGKYAKNPIPKSVLMTDLMVDAIKEGKPINEYLYNDLEQVLLIDYNEFKTIKNSIPNAIMTGSGSTYYVLEKELPTKLGQDYEIIENLNLIDLGVEIMQ